MHVDHLEPETDDPQHEPDQGCLIQPVGVQCRRFRAQADLAVVKFGTQRCVRPPGDNDLVRLWSHRRSRLVPAGSICRQCARPETPRHHPPAGDRRAGTHPVRVMPGPAGLAHPARMLHVRVVSPADVTGRLVAKLTADSGVSNLVVLRSAVTQPDGDSVQFDLAQASANWVLRQLRDLGLDKRGSVFIETVDAAIGDGQDAPSASYHRERAPVWDLVEARIRADAEYPPSFFGLLVFAGLIGACGILTNSQILVVGAMVVGPEYSAIIAVALGLDRRDRAAVSRGLMVLLAGFALAIAVTLAFAACIRWSGETPEAYLHGVRPVSDLINSPNLFSVVVAVIAGIVGVVSLTLAKATALTGVFISVTTIPAAADIGLSLVYRSWPEAVGSLEQLLLNVGLLIVVGAVGLHAQRAFWRAWQRRTRVSR
jgi:uncharacterized hydrophobic protein (TIGR00271 family)